ncbi:hypothetical protein SprV_0401588400 [Sparganum proliferum]
MVEQKYIIHSMTRGKWLSKRKWKCPTQLGGEGSWTYEVGEPPQTRSTLFDDIQESNANPIFGRLDTKNDFQWRIRNLPYPLSTYQLSIEDDGETIVLRTTNKKYFKRFGIPDLRRIGLKLDQTNLTKTHSNNTLVISLQSDPQPITAIQADESTLRPIQECLPSRHSEACHSDAWTPALSAPDVRSLLAANLLQPILQSFYVDYCILTTGAQLLLFLF